MSGSPLAGVKVVDMGWLVVAPETARYLSDLGADVIKLESSVRRDPLRALGPHKDGVPGVNRSMSFHSYNAGKRSMTLDIKSTAGRDTVLRLAKWADVFIEGFTPGVSDSLKLSYPYLSAVNPRLIMMSSSLLGARGPESLGASGTGITGSAFAGATNLLGWPDREPMGPHGPWTDSVTPRFAAATILAALHHRHQTGVGRFIDIAQAECGLQFLAPAYLEYAVNGVAPQRRGGGTSPYFVPSGVYPCAGQDRWLAIEVVKEEQWAALRHHVGGALLDGRFDRLIDRLRGRAEIDELLCGFVSGKEATALEAELQAAGVPAHVVAHAADLANDADLLAEGYYRRISAPEIGKGVTRGPPAMLSRTPYAPTRAGPELGDSTAALLKEACGYTDAEIECLEAQGALK